ncbi:uncharacterized protein LOC132152569 [Carassius carassius]|uniref:uncharacterized protein LOC132152569 n=1 Tax=Carassius carassius TaxID=217509 RepID=UPI002868C601|nr:uncharacterized protein LOC132152569 [Carassius carassius]
MIKQHINKTVFAGETVTLHCNKTQYDDDFTWKMKSFLIFRQDTERNRTMRNFSSNRIHIDPAAPRELSIHQIQASDAGNYSCYPAAIRWTLTITENQIRPESLKQMPLYIIIISCSGVIMICLIITSSICIHRKLRQKINSGSEDVKMISDCDKHTITACVSQLNTHLHHVYHIMSVTGLQQTSLTLLDGNMLCNQTTAL